MSEKHCFQPQIHQSHPRGICGAPDFIFGGRNACVSFRVRCKMFPSFQTTSQNRYEMTRAGAVQKAPDTFLRGAYWTPVCLRGVYWTPPYPPTQHGNYTQWHTCFSWFIKSNIVPRYDRHDTGNDTKWHAFLEANVGKFTKNAHILLWSTMNTSLFVCQAIAMFSFSHQNVTNSSLAYTWQ